MRFLGDFDEGVRYAAAQAVIRQEEEQGRQELLAALANPDEESNRFRVRIAETFATRRWTVEPHAAFIAENPPNGFEVQGNRLVQA